MYEAKKTNEIRGGNFIKKYLSGKIIDIGAGDDLVCTWAERFDQEDGDANHITNYRQVNSYDTVHSSHCLEHLNDPVEGLRNWLRVIRDGGYLVITVPDEDLYEQSVFPSSFNKDHKWTFTIFKTHSWSSRSLNLIDVVRSLGASAELVRIEQLNSSFRYSLPRFDQTLSPIGESGIELVIRKRSQAEIEAGVGIARSYIEPTREMLLHLNQYVDDMKAMKRGNEGHPPFENDSLI